MGNENNTVNSSLVGKTFALTSMYGGLKTGYQDMPVDWDINVPKGTVVKVIKIDDSPWALETPSNNKWYITRTTIEGVEYDVPMREQEIREQVEAQAEV